MPWGRCGSEVGVRWVNGIKLGVFCCLFANRGV